MKNSALTPTPIVLRDGRLRVYAGFRDDQGVSRIGWTDLDPRDPTAVLAVSKDPALDTGQPGCFDDNGVILGDVVHDGDRLRMYYVGFQLVDRVKFLAYSGVAESTDGGDSFVRLSRTPVLDRADEGLYIRAIHTALRVERGWRIWYAAGSGWETIGGQPFPRYHVRTLDSEDGLTFGGTGAQCLIGKSPEYRLGRPRVWRHDGTYHMLFTVGSTDGAYVPGYASSRDGITWSRDDTQVGMSLSASGWDSLTLCYIAPFVLAGQTYAVYNGNDMGKAGFGCAELTGGALDA